MIDACTVDLHDSAAARWVANSEKSSAVVKKNVNNLARASMP
jgi:hypothetical protein